MFLFFASSLKINIKVAYLSELYKSISKCASLEMIPKMAFQEDQVGVNIMLVERHTCVRKGLLEKSLMGQSTPTIDL